MARRDRRRGGAHSAPRKDTGPPAPVESGAGQGGTPPPGADGASTDATPAAPPAAGAAAATGGPVAAAAAAAPPAPGVPFPDRGQPLSRRELKAATRTSKVDGKAPKGKKKKAKHTWLDRVLLAGVIVVGLALVGVGTGYAYVQYRFSQVTKVTVKHLKKAPVGQPFNVLLIGSDSRVGESAAEAAHLGNQSDAGGQRSDVVKIVHIVPATGQVSVLSIPRDTVVTVAGDTSQIGKYNRINATYNVGPDQLVQTIEANFGIPIEHVVQINFEGFRGAVDAIGGIFLNFPYPAKDAYTGLNITQTGCQHVNGGYSLAVARSRHYEYFKDGYWQYDGTSDFGRIQRQNAFLKAVINQAEKQYNPLTLNAFIGSVVQGVTIDSTFSISDLISLAQQFHTFASQSLATATLPTYNANSYEFGYLGSVLYVQEPQATQAITQFLGGPPEAALTPPPGPYGVVSTTTTSTYPTGNTLNTTGGSTPATLAPSATTTTVETDFDPTPC
jgi:LCP family protein required for cell wall assembly